MQVHQGDPSSRGGIATSHQREGISAAFERLFCEVIARCFKLISRTRLCAPLVRQEFSQKELAAKTVSLNLLNDQSTSEVRDSVVSQAGWFLRSAAVCRETISLSQ